MIMAMKGNPTFKRVPNLEPLHQMEFRVINWTLLSVGQGALLLFKGLFHCILSLFDRETDVQRF